MKKYILCILLALFCIASNAQIKRDGDTFKIEQTTKESDTKTKFNWEDSKGNKYPIFVSKKGACYVIRVSKNTGKEYKYYLPKEIQEQIRKELKIEMKSAK